MLLKIIFYCLFIRNKTRVLHYLRSCTVLYCTGVECWKIHKTSFWERELWIRWQRAWGRESGKWWWLRDGL